MARPPVKYALGIVLMFLVTLAYASSEEENVYFEYDRAAPNVRENWENQHPREGEISQTKRAVAILNRLFLVAQRANKSQRLHRKEEPYPQFYQLPTSYAVKSAARNDEVLSNDINSMENNSEAGPVSTSDQKAMALPRLNFERRDQQTPRVFWRCYFNAVSCFR